MKHLSIVLLVLGGVFCCWRPDTGFLDRPSSALVVDEQGYLLSAQIASDGQWRLPLSGAVPEKFAECIVMYEDKRYYSHNGIDLLAIMRALRLNWKSGTIRSGASTLPMQLARLSTRGAPRTWINKLQEMWKAWRYSLWFDKSTVLQWYATEAPFGGNVVGLEAASWRYFGKQPAVLTWAESATLAVLPNAPSLIHVNRNRDELLYKRNFLLTRLADRGRISSLDLEASLMEPLPERTYDLPSEAPHYLQYVKNHNAVSHRLMSRMQHTVNEALREMASNWAANQIYNAGVLIIDTKSGETLAYVGNIPGTAEESYVDVVQARRSSGSILKPFLYTFLLDEGLLAPRALVRDVPIYINGFSPSNYNKSFVGLIHADEALQRSLNVPAVLLLQDYGIDKFLRRLKALGITTLGGTADYYGLSLILGGGEVTLWELTHAYRQLAIATWSGNAQNFLTSAAAYTTLDVLKGLKRPDEEGNWQRLDSAIPIAWKTGTSYGHRDAWAIGVTPDITIGVWVGNADGEGRKGIVGTSTAGSLLFRIVNRLTLSGVWFDLPSSTMQWTPSCRASGMLAGRYCSDVDTTLLPLTTIHTPICTYHQRIYVDKNGQYRLTDRCNGLSGRWIEYFYVDPVALKYMRLYDPELRDLLPLHPSCTGSSDGGEKMSFVYPSSGDRIFLPMDLNGKLQEMVATLAHEYDPVKIHWYLDDTYIGTTKEFHTMSLQPSKGKHRLLTVDQEGSQQEVFFEILAHQ